jgi:hypothetical protein
MGYSGDPDAGCARLLSGLCRGPGQEGVWRVCCGLSAAGGGVAKSNAAPLGVKVRYSSRADLSPSFCASCDSAIGVGLETALSAGLKPTICESAHEPGRRLPARSLAAHRPNVHSELRDRALLAALRRMAVAAGDRIGGIGAPPRADRAITRRRARRLRAWGKARSPRTSQSRPLRSRAWAAA